jgi:catechol 2,3-dioxygenase-like lactoylglutathione lyase family enzyme
VEAVKLLRAATLTVADLAKAERRYADFMDYRVVESGRLDAGLAQSWGAAESAGAPYCVMKPASDTPIYLRLVQQKPHPDYVPLRTYGWAAIEICVEDVLAANDRMTKSPFDIIGPPREIEGLPAIYPMQVKGPDGEIVYLTQIRSDLPAYDLPRATAPIDRLFIFVLACSDMHASIRFAVEKLGLAFGRDMQIVYTMLANAFGTPHEKLYTISTVIHERDVFLEFDQYPPQATPRPQHAGLLPPGVAIGSLTLPDFKTRIEALRDWLISEPAVRPGPVYDGRLSATVRGPDGSLFEVVAP